MADEALITGLVLKAQSGFFWVQTDQFEEPIISKVPRRLLEKRLDGFGELFRMLSYEQVGSAAMMSRACAGTIGRTAVFALPGSEHAVRLAVEKLIVPEIGHVVRELRR